jgi:cyclopropane-fatty-acyl-phospholipid synthase
VLAWTLTEYLVHRFVLHGTFPRREGRLGLWLHERFDRMHADHHQRPWDGMHVNGRFETIPFAVALAVPSFFGPFPAAPAFVAALLQCYVVEEWVHYAVHFHHGGGPYFRYIRRHHLYHHGVRGKQEAFGLTSHLWDVPFGTGAGSSAGGRLDGSASPPQAA